MNCQITTKELKDFNFFSEGYAKLFLKIFFYVSIIEFSFAPWFALYSNMTRLLSNVLYLCWFASLFCSVILSSFNKKRINKILPLICFFIIYIGIGFLNAVSVKNFLVQEKFYNPTLFREKSLPFNLWVYEKRFDLFFLYFFAFIHFDFVCKMCLCIYKLVKKRF